MSFCQQAEGTQCFEQFVDVERVLARRRGDVGRAVPAIDVLDDVLGILVEAELAEGLLEAGILLEDRRAAVRGPVEAAAIGLGNDELHEHLRQRKERPLLPLREVVGDDRVLPRRPAAERAEDADGLGAPRPRQLLAGDEAETEHGVAEGLGLLTPGERLLDVLARDLPGAEQDLVDAVGTIVRTGGEDVASLEVDDLDDAVVLEPDRARETLAPQPDEFLDEIDLADFAFEAHSPPFSY